MGWGGVIQFYMVTLWEEGAKKIFGSTGWKENPTFSLFLYKQDQKHLLQDREAKPKNQIKEAFSSSQYFFHGMYFRIQNF